MPARPRLVRISLWALCLLALTLLALLAACSDDTDSSGTSSSAGGTATTATQGGSSSGPQGVKFGDVAQPVKVTGNFTICRDCHSLLDRTAKNKGVLTSQFSHSRHLEQGAECASCHLTPTHSPDGIHVPTMVKCFGCHSQSDEAAPPGKCESCHPPEFPLVPASHGKDDWLPARNLIDSTQGQHTKEGINAESCRICHAPSFCKDCHKLDMPHPENWLQGHPQPAADVGGKACNQCHPNNNACQTCHHPGYTPEGPEWWRIHPQAVYEGGARTCISCHSTKTCAHCHTTGEYKEFD